MFEICEPIDEDNLPNTLIGCFIPETNKMRFLLRNLSVHQHTVCVHSLKALDQVQKELYKLKNDYPELHQYLEAKHIIALKWAVLFHDLGRNDPHADHEVPGTSRQFNPKKNRLPGSGNSPTRVPAEWAHSKWGHLTKTSLFFARPFKIF
jgi:UTP:GlnB (protein PII) uridylyltransferase